MHTVEVYNNSGKILSRKENQEHISYFDIERYAAGIYTVKIFPERMTYQIVKL